MTARPNPAKLIVAVVRDHSYGNGNHRTTVRVTDRRPARPLSRLHLLGGSHARRRSDGDRVLERGRRSVSRRYRRVDRVCSCPHRLHLLRDCLRRDHLDRSSPRGTRDTIDERGDRTPCTPVDRSVPRSAGRTGPVLRGLWVRDASDDYRSGRPRGGPRSDGLPTGVTDRRHEPLAGTTRSISVSGVIRSGDQSASLYASNVSSTSSAVCA